VGHKNSTNLLMNKNGSQRVNRVGSALKLEQTLRDTFMCVCVLVQCIFVHVCVCFLLEFIVL